MNFLNINISDENFAKVVNEKITNGGSLSMCRFGDGEIMFINKAVPQSMKIRFCSEWGFNEQTYKNGETELYNILMESLKYSDYLGVMNLNNEISKKINANNETWGINEDILKTIGRVKNINVCDHQLTRGKVFGDVNNFKEILGGHNLHIISPRTLELQKNNIDKSLGVKVGYTQVDYNATFADRLKIFSDIDKIKENVVLISLGVLGKDIPHYLAKRGKICLDFGATIDAWAGIISRPWFNNGNLQNHCLIKK